MREILFRGKRLDNQVWVEGYYLCLHGEEDLHIIVDAEGQYHRVDSETVGQLVPGLPDKNGKKVFDGDIIEAIYGNHVGECIEATVIVRFDDYELMWDIDHSYEIEVIGNIHDNPELLGGADNG